MEEWSASVEEWSASVVRSVPCLSTLCRSPAVAVCVVLEQAGRKLHTEWRKEGNVGFNLVDSSSRLDLTCKFCKQTCWAPQPSKMSCLSAATSSFCVNFWYKAWDMCSWKKVSSRSLSSQTSPLHRQCHDPSRTPFLPVVGCLVRLQVFVMNWCVWSEEGGDSWPALWCSCPASPHSVELSLVLFAGAVSAKGMFSGL